MGESIVSDISEQEECSTIQPRDTLSAGVAIPVILEKALSFEGPKSFASCHSL